MGDMIHDVHFSCGHVDKLVMKNANKMPTWMVADAAPPVGIKATCPECNQVGTITKVVLVQGWG